jgi:hypothetical protein
MKKKIKVLDIGGRYGIHPTWKYCEKIFNDKYPLMTEYNEKEEYSPI